MPIRIVPETERAWHAGISFWRGTRNLNATSIGIEHVNKGFEEEGGKITKWYPFDETQITTSGNLCRAIVACHDIRPQNVVAHGDIAPGRKHDPGILFPWERLYKEFGVGAWLADDERTPEAIYEKYAPKARLPDEADPLFFLSCLARYGYPLSDLDSLTTENTRGVTQSFRAHFSKNQRPADYKAEVDYEDMFWAWALDAKYAAHSPACL